MQALLAVTVVVGFMGIVCFIGAAAAIHYAMGAVLLCVSGVVGVLAWRKHKSSVAPPPPPPPSKDK